MGFGWIAGFQPAWAPMYFVVPRGSKEAMQTPHESRKMSTITCRKQQTYHIASVTCTAHRESWIIMAPQTENIIKFWLFDVWFRHSTSVISWELDRIRLYTAAGLPLGQQRWFLSTDADRCEIASESMAGASRDHVRPTQGTIFTIISYHLHSLFCDIMGLRLDSPFWGIRFWFILR